MDRYKIYPKVQNIKYIDKELVFDNANLILDKCIHKNIEQKIRSILDKKGVKISEAGSPVSLFVGFDNTLNYQAYKIKIDEYGIKISAKNNLGINYAILTLEQIFKQVDMRISYLEIFDYPTFEYRGLIEGYYGIPWTYQERKDLMIFASKYKSNVFIYAPKDDPYHREKWKELYPKEKLEKLKDLVQTGIDYSINFVWTIAPFYKQTINHTNIDIAIETIISKFEQLYDIGVRQFGVLGDDVGSFSTDIPIQIMKELSSWKKLKNDVGDFLYCPANYTLEHDDREEELNAYEVGFSDDVYLFHTGRKVCAPVDRVDIQEYKKIQSKLQKSQRKNPVFWLNWPVNDIDPDIRKIHMGPATMLDKTVTDLKGIVTNPMQEAYASMISIFSTSNYAWNTKDFDPIELWHKSIEIIDKTNYKDLLVILEHLTSQDDRGIENLDESWNIRELLISNIEKDFMSINDLEKLNLELKKIVKSIYSYQENSKNPLFLRDIKPYLLNLLYKLKAAIKFNEAFISLLNDQKSLSKALYEEGLNLYQRSKTYSVYVNPDKSRLLRVDGSLRYINEYVDAIINKLQVSHINNLIDSKEKLFYPSFNGSKFYRIPLLFKTNKGTILAICDKRNDRNDDYGNIDLVLRRREKGKIFDETNEVINLQEKIFGDVSAFTIDASIVQSSRTQRIFLFTTMFPDSKGFYDAKLASGYIDVEEKKYLKLFDKKGTNFYLKGNKVYTMDQKETAYRVVLKDYQPFRQFGDIYHGEMLIGNLLLNDGPLYIETTSYLAMTYSDDDGITWSDLRILNGEIKTDDMKFFGVCPSKGVELEEGRLIFSAYFTNQFNKQSSCLIVSDDFGESWHLKAIANDKRIEDDKEINYLEDFDEHYQLGESSIERLNDDRILMVMRNYRHANPLKLSYLISHDKGETFSKIAKDLDIKGQSWCQCGLLHFESESKEYVMISQPSSYGVWNRIQGKIHLFEVKGDELIPVNSRNIDFGSFAYSSLIKICDGKFGIFYEKGNNLNADYFDLIYREFDLDFILPQAKKEVKTVYKIYPKVKEIEYINKTKKIGRISSDLKISDLVIKNKIEQIQKDFSDTINKENVTILSVEIDGTLGNQKLDYYELYLEDVIKIKASSDYACFYALLTLEQILKQSKDSYRYLIIKDYASQKIRGVIEGYYGIPWGNKKRAEIIKFISKFKNNVFIFAPKDDPYHREKWFEYYPDEELNEIKKLVDLANELKVRYVWTISPFKKDCNPINEGNYPEMVQILINKFEQLYKIGVRQFGVLGDDVGKLPRDTVVDVMKKVSKWKKEKEDVFELLFVPESYVLADWGFDKDELDQYSKNFPEDVEIIFTGQTTCAPITQEAIDLFKNKEISYGPRRDPLFWLNWPVNDVDRTEIRRLFMGKASMLEKNIMNLEGTIINPMEEAIASFPAIFQVADYAWNSRDFDCENSWKDSFKYIDEKCADQLYEISKHMSSADNGGIEELEESEYIGEISKKVKENLSTNDTNGFLYNSELLKDEYKKIIKSLELFIEHSKNKFLVEEMNPYMNNLLYKSKAAIKLIELININIKGKQDKEKNDKEFSQIRELLDFSKSFIVKTKTSEFPKAELRAESGTKYINKNIEELYTYISDGIL